MWRKYNKRSAVYHTKNKIENFEFQVSFKNISSLIKVPKFDRGTETQSFSDSNELIEEVQIKWQEKIFSSEEVEVYRDVENCSTEIQKKYHNLISNGENVRQGKVFTYVHQDNFVPKEELICRMKSEGGILFQNQVEFVNEEVMYVLANLNPDTILFQARWRPTEGVLIVFPNFNESEQSPYYIEIDTDYRHLYSYTIKNISRQLEACSFVNGEKNKFSVRPVLDIDHLFDMPAKLSTRFLLLFEIKSATGFDYDDLHVRYYISIPDRFVLEEGKTTGSTHSSMSMKSVWKFGHCFQLTLLSSTKVQLDENIRIFFEVISIDSWGRERAEGFVHHVIELCPRSFTVDIPCYRVDNSALERIERFFIGGRRPFDVEKFSCDDGSMLNRYHSKTISSGSLKVQCQIIMQGNKDMTKGIAIDDQFCRLSLEDVLTRHHEARQRLQSVTQ